MGHPKLKKKSKRATTRLTMKIKKKISAHNKKQRRLDKKNKTGGPKKTGLVVAPNLCPFKEQVIQEMNAAKQQEKEYFQQCKMQVDNDEPQDELLQLLDEAKKKAKGFASSAETNIISSHLSKIQNVSSTVGYRKIVEEADVILQVVDARDPLGTYCKAVENAIAKHPSKSLVVVLNKVDLVPQFVLEKWLTHLRQRWPTIAFVANNLQVQKPERRTVNGKRKGKKEDEKLTKGCAIGALFLIDLLANYQQNKNKESIKIGVVGVAKVGKRSVINRLKEARLLMGKENGLLSKCAREANNITFINKPATVTADSNNKNKILCNLKTTIENNKLYDTNEVANEIFSRISNNQVFEAYNIKDYSNLDEFLLAFAKRYSLIGKKAQLDKSKAARAFIEDFGGKIQYHTLPPDNNLDSSSAIVDYNEYRFNEIRELHGDSVDTISRSFESDRKIYVPFIESHKDSTEEC